MKRRRYEYELLYLSYKGEFIYTVVRAGDDGNGRDTTILTSGNTLHTSAPDFVYDGKSIKNRQKYMQHSRKEKMAKN